MTPFQLQLPETAASKAIALLAAVGLGYAIHPVFRIITQLVDRISGKSAKKGLASESSLEERKPAHLWNTAMFFPDYHASEMDSTTQQYLWYFASAKISIRICIYNFSFPELESVIAQQYQRGLIVEVIAGHKMTAEQIRKNEIPCGLIPRKPGIPDSDQIMHHKFAIIDDEAVLTGSMNWTTEGIMTNSENIAITTNSKTVDLYLDEFFRLRGICEKARTFF